MDNTDQITPFPSTERGAGGKLRKPPPRQPPASPYARPSSSTTTTNRRWISKLVDPSFFSTSDSASTLVNPSSSTEEEVQATGKWKTGEQHNEDHLLKSNLHLLPSELSKMANTGDDSSKPNNSFDFVLPSHSEKGEQHENNKFSDIEQLVKGKKFTRDESDHIVGLLNSRAIDVSNVEQGKEHTNLTSRQDDWGLVVADKLPKVLNERRHEQPVISRNEMGTEPQNLLQKLHERTEKCTIGCPILDRYLNGGIPTKSITELVAESGSGKTQICLQLVLSAQLPPSHGGLSASSLYIYTEYPFPIRRLKQLSLSLLSSHQNHLTSDPLKHIILRGISSAENFVELLPDIELCLNYWKSRLLPIRVIVVDSIAALFRSEFENSCFDLKRRSSLFFKISGGLKSLAERFGLVVVVTNQVVDFIEENENVRIGNYSELYSSGRRVCPALGISWANCVNSRVFLSKDEERSSGIKMRRRFRVVFAPHLPQFCSEFVISEKGVFGVEMGQRNV